jgi:hypothetical protein
MVEAYNKKYYFDIKIIKSKLSPAFNNEWISGFTGKAALLSLLPPTNNNINIIISRGMRVPKKIALKLFKDMY